MVWMEQECDRLMLYLGVGDFLFFEGVSYNDPRALTANCVCFGRYTTQKLPREILWISINGSSSCMQIAMTGQAYGAVDILLYYRVRSLSSWSVWKYVAGTSAGVYGDIGLDA